VDEQKGRVDDAGKRAAHGQITGCVVEGTDKNAGLIGGGITANIKYML
jgi:hypothetical protein